LLLPPRVLEEALAHDEHDVALRAFAGSTGAPALPFNLEWLQEERSANAAHRKLFEFVGMEMPDIFRAFWPSNTSSLASAVETLVASSPRLGSFRDVGCGDPALGCPGKAPADCTPSGAAALLASYSHAHAPLLVIGAHSAAGGASLLGKVVTEACRVWLTPRLGLRCASRDHYDACHDEDLCFHAEARISAGRASTRGYRFVHVIRDPLDIITRSFLLAEPNATHATNASAIMLGLEGHIRSLLQEQLYDMQAMSDAQDADPHYMRVHLEDFEGSGVNATLARVFAFLLGRTYQDVEVPTSVHEVFAAAWKADERGSTQRKHLIKVLTKKPAKCHHVARLQISLGYAPMFCAPHAEAEAQTAGQHSDVYE